MATQADPVSWTNLSPSVQQAFGWARAATPDDAPVGSTGLLLGVLRAHAGYSEPEALLAHLGRPVTDLTDALEAVSADLDVEPKTSHGLSDLPELAPEGDLVVRGALNLASVYDIHRDKKVHVAHLFGGILRSGPNADVHRALRTVLGEAKAKASDDYVDYLRESVEKSSVQYAEFLQRRPLLPASTLPAPPEPFIGRERERDAMRTAIKQRAMVFLTGPHGTGKTALALRVASDATYDFPGGASYVSGRAPDPGAAIQVALDRSGNTLLVVDDADGLDVDRLLPAGPVPVPVVVIATQPAPSGTRGEHVVLGPLTSEEVQRLLRARVSEPVPDADLAPLVPQLGGNAAAAVHAAELLSQGLSAADLVAESGSLLDRTRAGASARDSGAWRELEPRYRGRQPHEQRLLRVAGLLEHPFSPARAALAADTDAQTTEVILSDLGAAGLVEETDDGQWSLPGATRTFAWSRLADEPEAERTRIVWQALAARHGIGLADEEPPALAGFRSDEPSERDHIGFGADLEALCSVLIAHEVKPPISVGLFGEWGTGKSTFMRLMRDRIRSLQSDWAGRDDSPFCQSVKQITFNPWNYSDANLWASLVTKIFDGLAASDPEVEGDQALGESQRAAIVNALETAKASIAEKEIERNEALEREGELRTRLDALEAEQREAAERLGDISPAEVFEKAGESGKLRALGDEVLTSAGQTGRGLSGAVAIARELKSTWGFAAHAARMLGRTRAIGLLCLTLGLVAVVGVAETLGVPITGTVTAVAGWLGSVAALARQPVERARKAAAAGDELLVGLREEQQAAVRREEAEAQRTLAQLAAQRTQLDSELQEAHSSAARAERELDDMRSGRRITQFVEERATSTEYTQYLGLIAVIRRDFDELSGLLLDSDVVDKPPFDRIILYIDDLDRCRAELVVQVLEAVHLLLALKLFVVVVGVDPRWLAQSLKRHYMGQLEFELENGNESDPAEASTTTPQNYLEKIFQIPYALRPMGTEGFSRMMGELFELRSVERATERPSAPPTPTPQETEENGSERIGDDSTAPAAHWVPPPRERTLELLRIWPAELRFIQRFGELVPTPRAANRLANTYRLIRVGQAGPALSRFVERDGEAGEYQVAVVLLTVMVGFPGIAGDVFRRLLEGEDPGFWPFVEALAAPEEAGPHTADAYKRLRDGLQALRRKTDLPAAIGIYREWVPRVARYSFETARIPLTDAVPEPQQP